MDLTKRGESGAAVVIAAAWVAGRANETFSLLALRKEGIHGVQCAGGLNGGSWRSLGGRDDRDQRLQAKC